MPTTPDQLEATFRDSDIYRLMMAEREIYAAEVLKDERDREEFREAVRQEKRRGVADESIFTVNFYTQVKALAIRQFQLKLQDRTGLIVSFITAIVVSLISGSVYLLLPATSAGAFQRGGVMFISVLFNSFQGNSSSFFYHSHQY